MIRKTLRYILPDARTKVLACGRTDAKVSANQTYIELFSSVELPNLDVFLGTFNYNLPSDIKALQIKPVDENFNVIQDPKIKTYHYYFAFGDKIHPFAASLMSFIHGDLDLELMQEAASAYAGKRDFYSYTFRPKEKTDTNAEVISCKIEENNDLKANFFPEKSYVLKIKGKGFKRNQIRLLMGMLIDLGRHNYDYNFFLDTLDGSKKIKLEHIAPASGLVLEKVDF
jgi:tRNA pseudouridine38-40 synthase